MEQMREERNMFARFVYFVAIGWWYGLFALAAATVLTFTIVLAPLGLAIFNNLPKIVFMRERVDWEARGEYPQKSPAFLVRALWFLFIGLPFGTLAFTLGYAFAFTIIGIPLAIFIVDRVPLLLTLNRQYA
jgi:uncharacterized membrane protein YccF (DUF307 family)